MRLQRFPCKSAFHVGQNWYGACNDGHRVLRNANQLFRPAVGAGSPPRMLSTTTHHHDDLAWRKPPTDFETLAITEGFDPSNFKSKCVVPPIVTSSIFMMEETGATAHSRRADGSKMYVYGRWGNPTRDSLEHLIASFDGAKHCLTFGSGMAAISSLVHSLQSGDHMISASAVYGGSYGVYKDLPRFGISASFVVQHDVDDFLKEIRPNTRLIAFESPANPTLTLVDISNLLSKVRELTKARGWDDIIIAVDNTFCTPIFQRPLELGADVVLYSCSKYMSGHGDLIMGALTTNSDEILARVERNQHEFGAVPSPNDCYLLMRSLKTMPLRMRQHASNAYEVAKFLDGHQQVERVMYPGLESHPQHALALAQQCGGSGMVGFYVKGGFEAAKAFLGAVKVFQRAPSLGAHISLLTIPSEISHGKLPIDVKEKLGISKNYIRLSVGLESSERQIADLKQALEVAAGA